MPETEFTEGQHVQRHRDGSIRARGPVVGEGTTYDRAGAPYKVTVKK
jgi:hypothetical protein